MVPRRGASPTTCTRRRTTRSTATEWRDAVRRPRARRASARSSTAQGCASASRISPGLVDGRDVSGRPRRARRQGRAGRRRRRRAHRPVPRRHPARPFAAAQRASAHADARRRGSTTTSASASLLSLVPTEYIGTLGVAVPRRTRSACSRRRSRSAGPARRSSTTRSPPTTRGPRRALGGRAPLLWDNLPVNDAVMADRLFIGPLRGRDAGLRDAVLRLPREPDGAATASMLPLASIAAWCAGDDPSDGWAWRGRRTRVDDLRGGVRWRVPQRLVR